MVAFSHDVLREQQRITKTERKSGDPWLGVSVPEKQRHSLGCAGCRAQKQRNNEEPATNLEGNSSQRRFRLSQEASSVLWLSLGGAQEEGRWGLGLRIPWLGVPAIGNTATPGPHVSGTKVFHTHKSINHCPNPVRWAVPPPHLMA